MIDANDFKAVNDTYGHAEGDRALTIIATALKRAARLCGFPMFISRYGGDEFLLIAHPSEEGAIKTLVDSIRTEIEAECKTQNTPYFLSVGIGYDMIADKKDTFQKCMWRADQKLYKDKRLQKVLRSRA